MQNRHNEAIIISMVGYNENDRFRLAKDTMLREHLTGRDITDSAVLEAMEQIPRQEFISEKYASQAYDDQPVPIGLGQTISQPYIVALMTQLLKADKTHEVLEIGTGSGYQTAILAKLVKRVYTVERYGQLSESAQAVLGRCNITNVEFYIGDGSAGWCEKKQFDRIIVTAAVPEVPQPLTEQLREGGLLVAPVGGEYLQELMVCEKSRTQLRCKASCPCRFVRLVGEYGFSETE